MLGYLRSQRTAKLQIFTCWSLSAPTVWLIDSTTTSITPFFYQQVSNVTLTLDCTPNLIIVLILSIITLIFVYTLHWGNLLTNIQYFSLQVFPQYKFAIIIACKVYMYRMHAIIFLASLLDLWIELAICWSAFLLMVSGNNGSCKNFCWYYSFPILPTNRLCCFS